MQMIPDRDNRQQNIYDIKKKEIYNIYLYTLEKNKWSTTRAIEAPAVEERHTHKRVVQQNCERDSVSSNIFFFLI